MPTSLSRPPTPGSTSPTSGADPATTATQCSCGAGKVGRGGTTPAIIRRRPVRGVVTPCSGDAMTREEFHTKYRSRLLAFFAECYGSRKLSPSEVGMELDRLYMGVNGLLTAMLT